MIRKAQVYEYAELLEYVRIAKTINAYLYIDVINFGFKADSIETYLLVDVEGIKAIMYEYYGSIQLLQIDQIGNHLLLEMRAFLLDNGYKRITGAKRIIDDISENGSTKWNTTFGYIMEFDSKSKWYLKNAYKIDFAQKTDFQEIASLICSDSGMGGSYSIDNLEKQLVNRYENDGCKNACIRLDGKIVSHFATYAITDDIAVLSGMVTDVHYRGRGLGSELVRYLSLYMTQRNITPIIFCYEREYDTWYQKLGYRIIGESAKLELR